MAAWSTRAHTLDSKSAFDQWVAAFPRTRAGARHFRRHLHARDGQPQARHLGVRELNRVAARIQRAALAISQSPRLRLAHHRPARRRRKEYARAARPHREGLRRRALGHARRFWGIESGLRRSARAEEPHAAGHPVAGGARLGRAAPAHLLGAGAAQRAGHHRARLEHAGGDARLLGRRHGPHPVDAGGLAQLGRRLRRRRPHLARSASPTTRSPAPRAISSSAATTAAASTGATRCARRGRRRQGASRSYEAWQKPGVTRADGQPFPQPERHRQALGAGAGRARPSCSGRISMPCAPTIRR